MRGSIKPGNEAEFESASTTSVGEGFENEATKPHAAKALSRERVIHLGTRCTTEAEFLQRFASFTTDKGLTMPGRVDLPPDAIARFVIALASRQPILEGRCRVLAPPGGVADNKVRLEFVELGARSRAMHAKLLRGNSVPRPKPIAPPPPLPPRAPPPLTARATLPSKVSTPPGPPPARAPVVAVAAATPAPIPAERAPGAAYQLPANPFGKVESEALESFVECTIFEEEGAPPPRMEIDEDGPTAVGRITVPGAGGDATIEEWDHDQQTPVAPNPKNLAQQAASIFDELAAKDPERTTAKFGSDLMASAYPDGVITSVPGSGQQPQNAMPAAMPEAAMPADPTELLPTQTPSSARRRTAPLVFTFAAGLLIGTAVGFVLRGENAITVATVDSTRSASQAAPPAEPKPAPAVATEVAPNPTAESDDSTATAPAPGACLADVVTKPPGASVYWNDKLLGETPLEGSTVPCGVAKITLRKPKFRPLTIDAEGIAGTTTRVEQDLRAPLVRLQITSTPPGSILQLNKRKIGTTPRTVLVPMKATTMVRVMRAGHEPWLRRVFPSLALTKIHATLSPTTKVPPVKDAVKPAATPQVPAKPSAVAPRTPFGASKTTTKR